MIVKDPSCSCMIAEEKNCEVCFKLGSSMMKGFWGQVTWMDELLYEEQLIDGGLVSRIECMSLKVF